MVRIIMDNSLIWSLSSEVDSFTLLRMLPVTELDSLKIHILLCRVSRLIVQESGNEPGQLYTDKPSDTAAPR